MNEVAKSVLRRVKDQSDGARIRGEKDFGEMEITPNELSAVISELQWWPSSYPLMFDGVKIKILWEWQKNAELP